MVKSSSQPLQIRLTEPVIFLRGPSTGLDFRGRPQVVRSDAQPAMLRGLLTLRLSKPTRIRDISIKLTGKARTEWPEGVGPKRLETYEENVIMSDSLTFFSAKEAKEETLSARRAMSVGPGVTVGDGEEDEQVDEPDDDSDLDVDDEAGPSRGRARHALRSASAMPGPLDGRVDRQFRLAGGQLAAAERSARERGPSPAYTPQPGPLDLQNSILRDHTPLRTILYANNSQNNSSRGDSESTERQYEASPRTQRHASSPSVQPLEANENPQVQFKPSLGSAALDLTGAAGPHRPSIDRTGSGEVRFAPAPSFSRDPSVHEGEEDEDDDDNDHDAVDDDHHTRVRSNRAASIRTMESHHSGGGSLSPQSSREGGPYHPTRSAVQPISTLTTPARSPILSASTSLHDANPDELDLPTANRQNMGGSAEMTSEESSNSSAPRYSEASRRGSSQSGMNHITTSLSQRLMSGVSPRATPSPSTVDLTSEVRQGRASSSGQTTTIVFQPGAAAAPTSRVVAAPSAHNSPRGSISDTRSPLQAMSSSTNRSPAPAPQPERSRFSISKALRGLSKSREASRSRSRQPSGDVPTRVPVGSQPGSRAGSRPGSRQPSYSSLAFMTEPRDQDSGRTGRMPTASGEASEPGPHRADPRDEEEHRARSREHSPRGRGRNKGMKLLTGALGLDGAHESPEVAAALAAGEELHNWKEFKKGTYNYPISFSIPLDAPPTIHSEFGSVTYKLKATVVRAGALTSNLVEDSEVIMIATPQEDDLEESENVVVERQWEEQMRYQIALSGKAFPIGGIIPFSVRLMPLAKCKVHRLSACLEEKTDYFALDKKVARHETPKRFFMLFAKQPEKLERIVPLLPIISSDVRAAMESPLAPLALKAAHDNPVPGSFEVDQEDDAVYASLMDPQGPWHLEKDLKIPDCATAIHFSTKHEKTNISVGHVLKVTIRVERGDDEALDAKGRRKQFDIIIETPIKILDCRVNSQLNNLPTYAFNNPLTASAVPSVCSIHGGKSMAPLVARSSIGAPGSYDPLAIAMGGGVRNAGFPSFGDSERGRPPLRQRRTPENVPLIPTHPNARETGQEHEDTLLERNIVYDRLISGQETETGELPPTYGEAVRTGSRSNSRARQSPRGSVVAVDESDSRSASRSQSRLRRAIV